VATGEEFVRLIWEQWNAGDREVRPEQIDPEVEIHSALTSDVYRGYEGVVQWTREIDDQFSDWQIQFDDVDESREGVLLVTGSIVMRGRQSGVDLEQSASWVLELREGRLLRLRNFVGQTGAAKFLAGHS
jgi:ketosteroid isomerase-like protein